MLKIRLRRTGKKNQPSYRVVVVEHTAPVQGSYLELLGTYNPRATKFEVNAERVLHWMNNGAQPSERVAKLLKNAGVEHKLIVLPDYTRKPKRAPKKAVPEAAAPAPAAEAAPAAEPATDVSDAPEANAAPEVTEETAPTETPAAEVTTEATPEATEPVADGSNSQPTEESTEPAASGTTEEQPDNQ